MAMTCATLLPFARPTAGRNRAQLAALFKAHRLPDALAAALVRESDDGQDLPAALTQLLAARLKPRPIDLRHAHGILLIGAAGAGKSSAAAKIIHAAEGIGRRVEGLRAADGLARLRAGQRRGAALAVMEAEGFNPLNMRAACAFSALGDIAGVETIGVVSALGDAQDVGEMVRLFRLRRVIVTGLDMARRMGALCAAALQGAQLAHVTRGAAPQSPLDDLDAARLAGLLLAPTLAH